MKLLIIHPEGNIKNNPNLYFFCKELVERGFSIKLYSKLRPGIYQGDLFPGAEFRYQTQNRIENFKTKKALLKEQFDYVIGIDEGIVDAKRLADAMGVSFGFLSYEIYFDNEIENLRAKTDLRNKKLSKKACQNIQFAIIQDEVRKQILIKEYDLITDKVFLMPVAATGIKRLPKSDYFYDLLPIPKSKKILLYMGWMDERQINRLVTYSQFLPEDWVIVIHSRYKYSGILPDDYDAEKIFFSLDKPVDNIEEIGDLLSGVDAGFSTYQADYKTAQTGDNIKYIGLSSGKTSTFLQHGVPVVIENMNMWDELVPQYNLGLVLTSDADLIKLNEVINATTKESCYKFFESRLDLKNFIDPIIETIHQTTKKRHKNPFPFYWEELKRIGKYVVVSVVK